MEGKRPTHTLTRLLHETTAGREGAEDELIELVYAELFRIAEQRMAQERHGHTLQAADLVHEAYLRLAGDLQEGSWDNRAHFFGAAAKAMRRILIDHARRRGRLKRGGGQKRLSITTANLAIDESPGKFLAIEEAIQRLEEWDTRLGQIVRLRFFAGLTVEEVARVLGVSPRTVKQGWTFARTWLYEALQGEDSSDS
jgi:RNA polymerase sigma factor (TIGR02999 family)